MSTNYQVKDKQRRFPELNYQVKDEDSIDQINYSSSPIKKSQNKLNLDDIEKD